MGIPFDEEKEMRVVRVQPAMGFFPEQEIYDYPVTEREAFAMTIDKHPVWLLTRQETQAFVPVIIPDNICRGMICENTPFDPDTQAGGKDMFGVEWVWVKSANGSMEREDVPRLFDDANDWKDVLVWPDVDSWDWEGNAALNESYLKQGKSIQAWIYTGFFERLISFMGFEDAAVAIIDEDQQDAVAELMMKLADLYCDIVDHFMKYYKHIDSFYVHDDWGSQNAPFFNAEIGRQLFVPAMRKLTDHIREVGAVPELHSCGCHGAYSIENIIAAGWACWSSQPMNPIADLWEKYGDQIVLAPPIDPFPADTPDEEMIRIADEFVEKFCTTPGKPVYMSRSDGYLLYPAFRRELYKKSREAFAAWPD